MADSTSNGRKYGKILFLKWILSYVLILLIPFIAIVQLYFIAERNIQEEVTNASEALLKQTRDITDLRFKEIEKLMFQIAFNSQINYMINEKSPLDEENYYTINMIAKTLKDYIGVNSFINNLYVYFENSNIFVTPSGINHTYILLDELKYSEGNGYIQWNKEFNNKKYIKKFYSFLMKSDDKIDDPVICYLQSLPLIKSSDSSGLLMIFIDRSKFIESFECKEFNGKKVLIIDDTSKVIATNVEENNNYGLTYDELPGEKGLIQKKIDGKLCQILYTTSLINNLKYIIIIPVELYSQKANYIKSIAIVETSICIIIGLLTSFYFSKRNYSPIYDIVRGLKLAGGLNINKKMDKMVYIKEAVFSTIKQKEEIEDLLEQQKPILKTNFIIRLLKGDIKNFDSLKESFDFFNLHFQSDYFCILLVYIEEKEKSLIYEDNDIKIANMDLLISSLVSGEIKSYGEPYFVKIDDTLIFLLNLDIQHILIKKDNLLETLYRVQNCMKDKCGVLCSMAVSMVKNDVKNISSLYQNVKKAIEYRFVIGKGQIIFYEDILHVDNEYCYSNDQERILINHIKAGDIQKTRELLYKIIEENLYEKKISIEIAKCLFFDLISTAIKAFSEIKLNFEDCFDIDSNYIQDLTSSSTLKEFEDKLVEIYEQTCRYIIKNRKSKNNRLLDSVIEYIEKNIFTKNDVSIASIARDLNMNAAYLGNFFREQTGQGIVEYINLRRISEAKKLISQGDGKIYNIAFKVGYNDGIALNRAFKKYEGLTPEQYRNNIITKQERNEWNENLHYD